MECRTKRSTGRCIRPALKIGDRPTHIGNREEVGHWEGDLIMGKGNKSAIVTLIERSSRFIIAFALRPGNRSDNMRDQLIETLGSMPATLLGTLTWDRGSEMAKHAEVNAALGVLVYFCDPASPWQRASNENANGLLRQYFRKGDDLSEVEPADVLFAAEEINSRPGPFWVGPPHLRSSRRITPLLSHWITPHERGMLLSQREYRDRVQFGCP
ncbi:IS30 family transposase [Paenarthrobacter ilicis]|uniref:IS30 family transposase n=1 Tax=Paenarthrobacter ilicis TaxID=43665 RepID=UPI00300A5934